MNSNLASSDPTTRSPAGWALVVDDHPLFCDALELTLDSFDRFASVVTADSLERAIRRLEGVPAPDLILLDLNLPDVTGLDGLVRLRRMLRDTPVIVVSSMTDDAVINGAIAAGAAGFVPKHSSRSVFRDALLTVERGEIFRPACNVEGADLPETSQILTRLSSLTNQQARILDLICEGKLNKQIAFDLSIAEATVKAHVTAIMRKLHVQSRTQAALSVQEAKFPTVLSNRD